LLSIYETGTGKIKIRGKVEVEHVKGGKKRLVISEIPYTMIGAGIGKFLNDVCALVEAKKTNDIIDISNQS
ncbi:Type IIA topoisomerase (DNA gyrase/topo II, topoisomerase IV), A subunit, partial [gut metagenome]